MGIVPMISFVLLFQSIQTNMAAKTCDLTLTQLSGEVESPNYPSRYDNGLDCTTDIKVGGRYVIELFFDDFQMESPETKEDGTLECYDKLTIVDTVANTSDEHCGMEGPFNYTSTGNHIQLLLHTDTMVNKIGYHALYQAILVPTTVPSTEAASANSTQAPSETGPNVTGSESGVGGQSGSWMNDPWYCILLGVAITVVAFSLGLLIFCFGCARRQGDSEKDKIRLVGHYKSTE